MFCGSADCAAKLIRIQVHFKMFIKLSSNKFLCNLSYSVCIVQCVLYVCYKRSSYHKRRGKIAFKLNYGGGIDTSDSDGNIDVELLSDTERGEIQQ